MKIKNVEISAFRIYDDPKNSTFDFSDLKGETADFVSLYAPNGFGKTSFYDAVEWGVTKSINRFYIRSKELEKLADFQAVKNKMPLVRNSKASGETFVKVTTDSVVFEEKFKIRGKQAHDINFKKPVVHDFQQVILSQEWISAFLTESDGETRYRKFMEKPDLVGINNYYNNLKLQLGVLENEKGSLESRIKTLEDQIIDSAQGDVLSNVNKQITLLTSEYHQQRLFNIELSTTKEQIKNLQDVIIENRLSSNRQDALAKSVRDVTIAKTGNDIICGVNLYFELKEILKAALEEIEILNGHIKGFETIQMDSNELLETRRKIIKILEQRKLYQEVLDVYEEYEQTRDSISVKKAELMKLNLALTEIIVKVESCDRNEAEIKVQLDSLISQSGDVNNLLLELPDLKVSMSAIDNEMLAIKGQIKELVDKIKKPEDEINKLDLRILTIRQVVKSFEENHFSVESVGANKNLVDSLGRLEGLFGLLTDQEKKLREITEQIVQQEQLNSTLQEFIKTGLGIVTETNSSNCPLCEHKYDSYIELATKISNNTVLDEQLKKLLLMQSETQTLLAETRTSINKERAVLRDFYDLDILEAQGKKQNQKEKVQELRTRIQSQETLLNNLQVKKSQFDIKIAGQSFEAREEELKKQHSELVKSIELTNEKINKATAEKIEARSGQLRIQSEMDILNQEMQILEKLTSFTKVTEVFKTIWPNQTIERSLVSKVIENLSEQVNKTRILERELEKKISENTTTLSAYNKAELEGKVSDLVKRRMETQQRIEGYLDFLKENLGIHTQDLGRDELSKLLENREEELRNTIKRNGNLIDEYSKLEGYCENIVTFLQSENARQNLIGLKEEKRLLEGKVEPLLKKEKTKTKVFLQEKIQEFFYEKLINDLYRKIDPHPEFKEVKFQADFESESARLDVFVKSGDGETMLIPNLYFSTAQINILSLSIFLATALNSTKYDCIFIDDPIQSMDSINVLSTIDLFRSIVVNHKKQIILSTHDENFHNLLQKKMPSDKFKSKFLELESFGKLKDMNI